MAVCLSFTQFLSLPSRNQLNSPVHLSLNLVQLQDLRLRNKWCVNVSRKKNSEASTQEGPSDGEVVLKKETPKASKRTTTRSRKKATSDSDENDASASSDVESVASASSDGEVVLKKETPEASKRTTTRSRKKATSNSDENEASASSDVESVASASTDDIKKTTRRTRLKATTTVASPKEDKSEKKVRRRTKKKPDSLEAQGSESDLEEFTFITNVVDESEDELELPKDDGEVMISPGWPPLVCCFGAAHYLFIPSGRPADKFYQRGLETWYPKKYVRAPGGSAASVAVILASLGGKVAFMGKVGNDCYGDNLTDYLHNNNVQISQSVCLDTEKSTAVTQMKISTRGHMRVTTVKSCAEDSLSQSEINIDVLKEAKILYVNTHSLLDENMRSTTLQAINIAKKLGGLIFYDVNLPLPLWHSNKETKMFIQKVWNLADIIEVTNQELEFLRGITPSKKLDDNTKAHFGFNFTHYNRKVIEPLWHENLKVLFVTNGALMIQYFTSEHTGAHFGSDPPITTVTGGMPSLGDAIAAALMRQLSFQPTHQITDKKFLEQAVHYAITNALIEQWKTTCRDYRALLSAKKYKAGMFSWRGLLLKKLEKKEE